MTLVRPARDEKVARRFQRSYERSQSYWEANPYLKPLASPHLTYPLLKPCEMAYIFQPALIVDTEAVLKYLQAHLKSQGARFVFDVSEPPRFVFKSGAWQVKAGSKITVCQDLVLAVAEGFEGYFENQLPMDYLRGETIIFESKAFENLTYGASAGGFFAPIGQSCITSGTTFYEGAQQNVETSIQTILKKIEGLIELPEDVTVKKVWSGVRTILRHDREPLVGPLSHLNDLHLFTAFSTRGYLQIPQLASQLARLILNQEKAIPEPYSAQRAFT